MLLCIKQEIAEGKHTLASLNHRLAGLHIAVTQEINQNQRYSLRRVINATGVILHTNLGRAPLSVSALEHMVEIATGYSNLELDLETGERSRRDVHAEKLLLQLLSSADSTEEHLAICSLLGVSRGLTVITKVDAVSPGRLEAVRLEIETFLKGTFLDGNHAGILPVSAQTGQGLDQLRRELQFLAMSTTVHNPHHLPRLPLDRAFVMKGFGTVVTGTLLSGEFHVGESLALEPGGRIVRVRGMQIHNRPEDHARSGSRVALNLAGIEVSEASRGQTLVPQETLTAVTTIDVEATLLSGSSSLKHRSRVHFHAFTSETLATSSLYGYDSAEPGTQRFMRLKLHKPVVLVPGDRFVLRQSSPAATVGGGRVLDARPLPNLRKGKCLAWLEALKHASLEEQLRLRVARRGTAGLTMRKLMAETGLTQKALHQLTEPLVSSHRLLRIPDDVLLTDEAFASATEEVLSRLKTETRSDGVRRSELKDQTGLSKEIFDFLLEKLVRERRLRLHDTLVYASGSDPQVPESRPRVALRDRELPMSRLGSRLPRPPRLRRDSILRTTRCAG